MHAQFNNLGIWPYWRHVLCDTRSIIVAPSVGSDASSTLGLWHFWISTHFRAALLCARAALPCARAAPGRSLRDEFFFVKDCPSAPPPEAFLPWPNVGHVYPPLFWDPRESRGYVAIPPSFGRLKRGYVATLPTCGPLLILPPALKRWGPPGGRGYVATLPTCGPPLILPPALKRWGSPRRHGLCTHLAHLWATSDASCHSSGVGGIVGC